ncbi:protein MIZU-KUSSEI 1-like [Panicum hallii]|uniref:protein MIZU-KUSSEI 1-like n=1 Tax=Panicum hallii TaxID=206008 RepID=UPI000DF4CB44|nr:protein MIZU-KUSSEI 1-like [Panicum hallii]
MGFAIYPTPGRPSDDTHSHRDSLPSVDSTRTSSSTSSFDGRASYDGRGGAPQRPPRAPGQSLEVPSRRHREGRGGPSRPARLFQKLRHAIPVLTLTPRCGRLQVGTPAEASAAASSSASSSSSATSSAGSRLVPKGASFSGTTRPCRRLTGTLYGHRRGRVVLALQETPRCLPSLVVELALQTHALLRELGNPAGARIVLETERRPAAADAEAGTRRKRGGGAHAPPLLDEPAWTMFCNGKKTGYAVRREATDDDLTVMETLRAVSMGAGVLPGTRCSSPPADAAAADDEVPYLRGCFDHFIGSRDSESIYMIAPQGGTTGPELAVFFVRL